MPSDSPGDEADRGGHCAECGEWYPADGEAAGVMGGRFLCAECCGEPVVFVVECLDCDELDYRYSGQSSNRYHVKQRVQQEGNSHETRKAQFEDESHETVWREVEPTAAEQQNPVRPESVEMATDGGRPRDVGLQKLTAVTWTDDDGTQYRRTIEDGEIVDREVSR